MEPNINLNRPPLSDEEIEKGKNFDKLLQQFKEQSISKARKDKRLPRLRKLVYTTLIAGAVVVCTVTFNELNNAGGDKVSSAETANTTNNKVASASRRAIQPLSPKIKRAHNTYKVDAQKGGTITHPTSSSVKIPESAFVKKNGTEVKGEVEIQYCEMHDPIDILVSGIPMIYDSLNKKYDFETAGMIDIKGFQNGEPVYLKPGKEIEISLASRQEGSRFNLYQLDTVSGKWIYLGKDKINDASHAVNTAPLSDTHPTNGNKINNLQKQIIQIDEKKDSLQVITARKIKSFPVASEPVKPKAAHKDRKKFTLDVDFSDFPELEAYKGLVFEVGDENQNYNTEFNKIEWHEASISKGTRPGENYTLNLRFNQRREKLIVYPVLGSNDLKVAMNLYELRFKEYERILNKRQVAEEKLKQELEAKLKFFNEEQKKLSKEAEKERKRIQVEALAELGNGGIGMGAKLQRVFNISNFGIYNTDCPHNKPKGAYVNARFTSNKHVIQPEMVYLIPYGKTIIYSYTSVQLENFSFNPQEEYYLVTTMNDKLYICNKETFKKTCSSGAKTTFELEEITTQATSAEELRKKLGV